MRYESSNSGLLSVDMVKSGDKIIILEEAVSKFVAEKQKTYWNVKVEIPNGEHKLAGLMDSALDAFSAKWGGETTEWIGRQALVSIKQSKSTGNDYIWLTPCDDERIDIDVRFVQEHKDAVAKQATVPAEPVKGIEYPKEDINPADIPF
jgi:hypothetical protein